MVVAIAKVGLSVVAAVSAATAAADDAALRGCAGRSPALAAAVHGGIPGGGCCVHKVSQGR